MPDSKDYNELTKLNTKLKLMIFFKIHTHDAELIKPQLAKQIFSFYQNNTNEILQNDLYNIDTGYEYGLQELAKYYNINERDKRWKHADDLNRSIKQIKSDHSLEELDILRPPFLGRNVMRGQGLGGGKKSKRRKSKRRKSKRRKSK
jgi:hypothetical protein